MCSVFRVPCDCILLRLRRAGVGAITILPSHLSDVFGCNLCGGISPVHFNSEYQCHQVPFTKMSTFGIPSTLEHSLRAEFG